LLCGDRSDGEEKRKADQQTKDSLGSDQWTPSKDKSQTPRE
jgi:hypothetical protein